MSHMAPVHAEDDEREEGGEKWRLKMAIGRAERANERVEQYKGKVEALEKENVSLRLECENWRAQVSPR